MDWPWISSHLRQLLRAWYQRRHRVRQLVDTLVERCRDSAWIYREHAEDEDYAGEVEGAANVAAAAAAAVAGGSSAATPTKGAQLTGKKRKAAEMAPASGGGGAAASSSGRAGAEEAGGDEDPSDGGSGAEGSEGDAESETDGDNDSGAEAAGGAGRAGAAARSGGANGRAGAKASASRGKKGARQRKRQSTDDGEGGAAALFGVEVNPRLEKLLHIGGIPVQPFAAGAYDEEDWEEDDALAERLGREQAEGLAAAAAAREHQAKLEAAAAAAAAEEAEEAAAAAAAAADASAAAGRAAAVGGGVADGADAGSSKKKGARRRELAELLATASRMETMRKATTLPVYDPDTARLSSRRRRTPAGGDAASGGDAGAGAAAAAPGGAAADAPADPAAPFVLSDEDMMETLVDTRSEADEDEVDEMYHWDALLAPLGGDNPLAHAQWADLPLAQRVQLLAAVLEARAADDADDVNSFLRSGADPDRLRLRHVGTDAKGTRYYMFPPGAFGPIYVSSRVYAESSTKLRSGRVARTWRIAADNVEQLTALVEEKAKARGGTDEKALATALQPVLEVATTRAENQAKAAEREQRLAALAQLPRRTSSRRTGADSATGGDGDAAGDGTGSVDGAAEEEEGGAPKLTALRGAGNAAHLAMPFAALVARGAGLAASMLHRVGARSRVGAAAAAGGDALVAAGGKGVGAGSSAPLDKVERGKLVASLESLPHEDKVALIAYLVDAAPEHERWVGMPATAAPARPIAPAAMEQLETLRQQLYAQERVRQERAERERKRNEREAKLREEREAELLVLEQRRREEDERIQKEVSERLRGRRYRQQRGCV
jgi:hypothetical protein